MTVHTITQTVWVDETDVCSLEHLADVSGLTVDELQELIDIGVIEPVSSLAKAEVFSLQYVVIAAKARRLRDDFELDIAGMAVAMQLLRQIHHLEKALLQRDQIPH